MADFSIFSPDGGTTALNVKDAKARDIVSDAFDSETSYDIGDYCIYEGALYKCTTAHTGAWNAADFSATTIAEELKNSGGGGTADAVKYTEQTLTDAQKTQARTNIGTAEDFETTKTVTGTNTITLTNSADSFIRGFHIRGHSEIVNGNIRSVGDNGGITITTANTDNTETSSLTFSYSLNSVDSFYDSLYPSCIVRRCIRVNLGDTTWVTEDSSKKIYYFSVSDIATNYKILFANEEYILTDAEFSDMPDKSYKIEDGKVYFRDTSWSSVYEIRGKMVGQYFVYNLKSTSYTITNFTRDITQLKTYNNTTIVSVPANASIKYDLNTPGADLAEKANINYSTTEQFTGQYWVNGLPIYQKTFVFNPPLHGDGAGTYDGATVTITENTTLPGMRDFISISGIGRYGSGRWLTLSSWTFYYSSASILCTYSLSYSNGQTTVRLPNQKNSQGYLYSVTLRYTKNLTSTS